MGCLRGCPQPYEERCFYIIRRDSGKEGAVTGTLASKSFVDRNAMVTGELSRQNPPVIEVNRVTLARSGRRAAARERRPWRLRLRPKWTGVNRAGSSC